MISFTFLLVNMHKCNLYLRKFEHEGSMSPRDLHITSNKFYFKNLLQNFYLRLNNVFVNPLRLMYKVYF